MKKLLILLAGLLLFSVESASAFPLWQGYGTSAGTQFEDDNLDFLIKANGNTEQGVIEVGDVLWSAIEFPYIINKNDPNPATNVYTTNQDADELVAIAKIELLDIVDGRWIFGEHDDGIDGNDDSMVKFYTMGGPLNFSVTSNPTQAEAEAAIADGDYLWSFSVTDDKDTFWVFDPRPGIDAGDTEAVRLLGSTTKAGFLNYALNQTGGKDMFNPLALDGLNILDALFYNDALDDGIINNSAGIGDGLVDLKGSGDILGGEDLTSAFARSDIDLVLNPIPEPATMTLFGISLLGLAFVGRRRK